MTWGGVSQTRRGNGTGSAKEDIHFTYDAPNQVLSAHENYGHKTRTYEYDTLGNLIYETAHGNNYTDYKYNNLLFLRRGSAATSPFSERGAKMKALPRGGYFQGIAHPNYMQYNGIAYNNTHARSSYPPMRKNIFIMNMKLEDIIGANYYMLVAEEEAKYGGNDPEADPFIMLPVVDFVFKLLFGDARRTERLQSLLSSILKLPREEFEDITIMNPELPKEFSNDKYGILDIRAGLKDGKQINIEIQVLPFSLMPERTLYYWAKLYTQQIKKGESFKELKQCIAINILDYDFPLAKKVHSVYSLREEETGERLTEVEEIHFLDLEKLRSGMGIAGLDTSLLKWLRFLASKSKGEFEMLARNDEEIKDAYDYLREISADDKKRMEYEAREMWLMDQRTREFLAREEGMAAGVEKGREEGIAKGNEEGLLKVVKNASKKGMDMAVIEEITGLSSVEIENLVKKADGQ